MQGAYIPYESETRHTAFSDFTCHHKKTCKFSTACNTLIKYFQIVTRLIVTNKRFPKALHVHIYFEDIIPIQLLSLNN